MADNFASEAKRKTRHRIRKKLNLPSVESNSGSALDGFTDSPCMVNIRPLPKLMTSPLPGPSGVQSKRPNQSAYHSNSAETFKVVQPIVRDVLNLAISADSAPQATRTVSLKKDAAKALPTKMRQETDRSTIEFLRDKTSQCSINSIPSFPQNVQTLEPKKLGAKNNKSPGVFSAKGESSNAIRPLMQQSINIVPLIPQAGPSSPKNTYKISAKTPDANKNSRTQTPKSIHNTYPDYLDETALNLLEKIEALVVAPLRINAKCSNDSYLSAEDDGPDFILEGVRDRNRALDGDVVYAVIKPKQTIKFKAGKSLSPAAVVVGIKTAVHNRTCIGSLSPFSKKPAFLISTDNRLPKLKIDEAFLPNEFLKHPMEFQDYLYASCISKWDDVRFAHGGPLKYLGIAGTAVAENEAILLKYDLDITPYPPEFSRYFPPADFVISPAELANREDLRGECVFTIDPETAKDLDDAVSCKMHSDGSYTIGVHISDVTYYLPEGTALDQAVSQRATTVYLVDVVHHMLPKDLCSLCSLTPGADKLTFSVFWNISPDGEIVSQRFARTVINSVTQLSYEHAQAVLDNRLVALPPIRNGFTEKQVKESIIALNTIADKLRAIRVENGALRIDQVKVSFMLDSERKKPLGFVTQEQLPAHRLIEEFMLLANSSVALFIQKQLPDLAFLRRHDPPKAEYLGRLQAQLEKYGVALDITSSKTLQTSLARMPRDTPCGRAQLMVIFNSMAKPMMRAKYFCSKSCPSPEDRHHYALSVDHYTHFTSPIRRYADIMVHHLLATALALRSPPDWTPQYVQSVADTCNIKKFNAKMAADASTELFFSLYVGHQGSVITEAVVCNVGTTFLEALLLSTGIPVKIYFNSIDGNVTKEEVEATIIWSDGSQQKVDMFSIVVVELTRAKGVNLDARLLPEFECTFQFDASLTGPIQ